MVANGGSKIPFENPGDSQLLENKWSRRVGLNHRPADYEKSTDNSNNTLPQLPPIEKLDKD
jgi:hypothetical protein